MKKLIKYLKDEVAGIERRGEDMHDMSWAFEEGVLITGSEAQSIVDLATENAQLKSEAERLREFAKDILSRYNATPDEWDRLEADNG